MWKSIIISSAFCWLISGAIDNPAVKVDLSTRNVTNGSVANYATGNVTKKPEMERITQPVAQTQQIERTTVLTNTTNIPEARNDKESSRKSGDFRPSPHLETYYEFNKFPVIPAFPEAKQIHQHTHYEWGAAPSGGAWGGTVTSRPEKSAFPVSTETPWKVKFPSPIIETSKDRPYEFYNEKSFDFPTSTNNNKAPSSSGTGGFFWDNNNNNNREKSEHSPTKHHNFDFSAKVPTNFGNYQHKTHSEPNQYEVGHSFHNNQSPGLPWKKIIKFLTAFIPIGLLISALTPTVITVTPMNGTQTRSRSEDSLNRSTKKLISSLNYFGGASNGCEDRILCELLVSASGSKNAEQHVENLLNTFTQDGKAFERAEDLKRVFEAVKKDDCEPIICRNIKEKKT